MIQLKEGSCYSGLHRDIRNTGVKNIPRLYSDLNVSGFLISRGSEHPFGSEYDKVLYTRVLNMQNLQCYEYA